MTIGTLAATAHVTTGTIRYYERLGLLPPPARTPSGYRQYSAAMVHRLAVIRNAKEFGFSLKEIGAFLRLRDRGGKPCERVREAAERMLTSVDVQIAELTARRQRMFDTLRMWDRRLAEVPAGNRAYLLEML